MCDVSANLPLSSLKFAGGQGTVADYFALLKPRVMSLVIFTGFSGLVAAPGTIHPWLGIVAILAIAVGAGAAGALNMWYDADIDALMKRTAKRPVPRGAILPREALGFGLTLAIGSVLLLGLCINLISAALLAFTIFFYSVIYTIFLKRYTPQNIVIGGIAGALPPVIGWAAVTGSVGLGSLSLFLIIFLWTPPHFWALALGRSDEYARAALPMLPIVSGPDKTRQQILLYSFMLVFSAFIPAALGIVGAVYLGGVVLLNIGFLFYALSVYYQRDGARSDRALKGLFRFSIFWLFWVFALILIERFIAIAPFPALIG